MVTPSRNEIYEAVIRRMVAEALREQDAQFAETHASDTARQLADYLYRCAMQLGHTPWPGEITGGAFLKQRFGTWEAALTAAKLPPPKRFPPRRKARRKMIFSNGTNSPS